MSGYQKGRVGRFLKLGGLTTKVGASYLGQKLKGAFVSDETKATSLVKANVRNARRIVKTLGELKGTVMKVGQMLSLQADVLPREVTEILSSLQKHAPPVPFAVIRRQVERELGRPLAEVFTRFDEEAYAAASIGQVHRARLPDGREVVVKVQYPEVHRIVENDLANLRHLFKMVGQLKNVADLDTILAEVRARMLEEVDYCNERLNLEVFRELFADDPRVLIPEPVVELTTPHLLTMELLEGQSADALCQPEVPQERRDRLGQTLVDLILTQVFRFRTLHADPNLANYAFTDDDRVIIYDFGCVKRFTPPFLAAYRRLVLDGLERRFDRLPDDLAAVGFTDPKGTRADPAIVTAYATVLLEPWDADRPYNFGTSDLHQRLMALGLKHWHSFSEFSVPSEIVFFNRVVGGMYGNLRRLHATGPWGALLRRHLGDAQALEAG